MESKFLDQDVDVVSLANKGIVLDALSAGTITKFSWRRESSRTTSGSRKMDSDRGAWTWNVELRVQSMKCK